MEFLVTMTTQVPEGTPAPAIDDIRAREALRARELAAQGHLLRLWRPPLQPGEWRTLGLFAADDPDQLEEVLASMPLRVWRTDEVAPLGPHPNDPVARSGAALKPESTLEFLVEFTIAIPEGTPASEVAERNRAESAAAADLVAEGVLVRLWKPPQAANETKVLGVYRTATEAELRRLLEALPMFAWMRVTVTPLSVHPSDPGSVHPG